MRTIRVHRPHRPGTPGLHVERREGRRRPARFVQGEGCSRQLLGDVVRALSCKNPDVIELQKSYADDVAVLGLVVMGRFGANVAQFASELRSTTRYSTPRPEPTSRRRSRRCGLPTTIARCLPLGSACCGQSRLTDSGASAGRSPCLRRSDGRGSCKESRPLTPAACEWQRDSLERHITGAGK